MYPECMQKVKRCGFRRRRDERPMMREVMAGLRAPEPSGLLSRWAHSTTTAGRAQSIPAPARQAPAAHDATCRATCTSCSAPDRTSRAGRNLGSILVDTGTAQNAIRCSLRSVELTPRPVRYIINTHSHTRPRRRQRADRGVGRSAIWTRRCTGWCRQCGSSSGDHRARGDTESDERAGGSAGAVPVTAWPTATFSGTHKEFFYNGEGVQLVHVLSAHTDGDTLVFFRRSDVIATGDVFSTVSYPMIDVQRGGQHQRRARRSESAARMVIAGEKTEGGRCSSRSRTVSDEADLGRVSRHGDDHPRPHPGHGQAGT